MHSLNMGVRALRIIEPMKRTNCKKRLPRTRMRSCHSYHHCTAPERSTAISCLFHSIEEGNAITYSSLSI